MPRIIACDNCSRRFSLPDGYQGKAARCPACKTVVSVQQQGAAARVSRPEQPRWHLHCAADSQEYGPFSLEELRESRAQGRLAAEDRICREGATTWEPITSLFPDLNPPAVSTTPFIDPRKRGPGPGVVSGDVGFRPRQYVGLTIVCYVYYSLTILIALTFLLQAGILLLGLLGVFSAAGSAGPNDPLAMLARSTLLVLVCIAFLFITHGFAATLCVACAELIRLLLDVQQNTQETAYYTRKASLA